MFLLPEFVVGALAPEFVVGALAPEFVVGALAPCVCRRFSALRL
jgi:hypothetical protein